MPWSSCKTQNKLKGVFVDILFHFGLGIFVILVFYLFVLTFILGRVCGEMLFFFFLLILDFVSYFCFCFRGTTKLGREGEEQYLGEVGEGDKHAQNILYEKMLAKRWVCKLKQVVVLIQCSSGKFYKSDFLV